MGLSKVTPLWGTVCLAFACFGKQIITYSSKFCKRKMARNPYVVSRQGVGICVRLLTISVDCGWDYSQSQRIGRFLYIPFVP